MPSELENSFSSDMGSGQLSARRSASLKSPQQIMCTRLSKMKGLSKTSAKGFIQDIPDQLEKPKRKRSVLDDDESAFNKIIDAVTLDYTRNLQQQTKAVSQLMFSQFSQQFASLVNNLKLENTGKKNVETVQSIDHFYSIQYADSAAVRQLEQLLIQYENLDQYVTKKQINSLFLQYKPVIALYQYELEQQLTDIKTQPKIEDMLPRNSRFEQI